MILTKDEESMAEGKSGPGIERCMKLLIKYGEALGGERLVNVTSAHVFNGYPLDLLTELAEGADGSGAFTTLHPFMSLSDPSACEAMGISEKHYSPKNEEHEQKRQVYKRLGFFETYTCTPHLVGNLPKKGDFVSWFGSGVQLVANSIIGAKQNRDGAVVNMAIALTGKAPLQGLYLDENRYAEVLVEVGDVDLAQLSTTDYGAIGYYVGGRAQDKNTVIDGLSRSMTLDQIKYLLTPMSTSGAVSICHIVGVTPEAPELKAALGNKAPKEKIHVGKREISSTIETFSHAKSEVDLVLFGCPHCSIQELKEIAIGLQNKKVGMNQRLWIGTAHQTYDLAQTMGYSQIIEKAGGTVARTCMATLPDCPIPEDVKVIVTNSFKTAHYVSAISRGRIEPIIGHLEACVQAAVTGRWEGEC